MAGKISYKNHKGEMRIMDIGKFLWGFTGEKLEKFNEMFDSVKEEFPPDVAVVLSFEKAILGKNAVNFFKDAFLNNQRQLIHNTKVSPDEVPKVEINEQEFFLVPKMITVSGVNLNLQFKSKEETKKIAKNQKGHIIPCINDHPANGGVEVKNHEISGFIFGIHDRELPDGEVGIFGIDAVPAEFPELLDTFGDSIGYRREVKAGYNTYKEMAYFEEESDITIIHNARMVNQIPAVPPDQPKYQEGEAHGVGIRPELIGGDPVIQKMIESLNANIPVKGSPEDGQKINNFMRTQEKEVNSMEPEELEKQNKKLSQDLLEAQNKIKELEAKDTQGALNSKDETINTLNSKIEEQTNSIKELETKNAELNGKVEELKPFKEQVDAINQENRNKAVVEFKKTMKDQLNYWTDEKIEGTDTNTLVDVMNAFKKGKGEDTFTFGSPVKEMGNSVEEEGQEEESNGEEAQNKFNRDGGSIGTSKNWN